MEKKNDIELRSEEVQEVMGEIPSWIIRWGITLLTAVVLTLVIGSCFFRYPDVKLLFPLSGRNQHPDDADQS